MSLPREKVIDEPVQPSQPIQARPVFGLDPLYMRTYSRTRSFVRVHQPADPFYTPPPAPIVTGLLSRPLLMIKAAEKIKHEDKY